jgi:hypothetical protein
MRRLILAGALLGIWTHVVSATTITFDEPEALAALGGSLTQFSASGVLFTPFGDTPSGMLPLVTPRGTFDNRAPAPYPYDFISGNVLQVSSTDLRIDLPTMAANFGFGAALNSTASPGLMLVELLGEANASLGAFTLVLDRTVLSQAGGTNSNSEGEFFVSGPGGVPIRSVLIHNFGDGTITASRFHWVLDDVTFEPAAAVPEPGTLLLLGLGLAAAATHGLRKRRRQPNSAPQRPGARVARPGR